MTFPFCGDTKTRDEAIDAGWIPSFWHGDLEYEGPVCTECTSRYLQFNEDYGDFETKPGIAVPPGCDGL
jgi:hypothetical protein